jgi:hypothetical protein
MTPEQRAAQKRDIDDMTPEMAAQMCRHFERRRLGDVETRLALARRGQLSGNPGEAESMRKYEQVFLSGRRVQYGVLKIIDVSEVQVTPEMREAIEEVFRDWSA